MAGTVIGALRNLLRDRDEEKDRSIVAKYFEALFGAGSLMSRESRPPGAPAGASGCRLPAGGQVVHVGDWRTLFLQPVRIPQLPRANQLELPLHH